MDGYKSKVPPVFSGGVLETLWNTNTGGLVEEINFSPPTTIKKAINAIEEYFSQPVNESYFQRLLQGEQAVRKAGGIVIMYEKSWEDYISQFNGKTPPRAHLLEHSHHQPSYIEVDGAGLLSFTIHEDLSVHKDLTGPGEKCIIMAPEE